MLSNLLIPPNSSKLASDAVFKVSKYGAFSDPYFPIFGLNTELSAGKYGPEKISY